MNPYGSGLFLTAAQPLSGVKGSFSQAPATGHSGCFPALLRLLSSYLLLWSFPVPGKWEDPTRSLCMRKLQQILGFPEMLRAQENSGSQLGSFWEEAALQAASAEVQEKEIQNTLPGFCRTYKSLPSFKMSLN